MFDTGFDFIIELVAIVPEKFDAVILVGIVRSGEDDAGIGAKRSRDVGHTRCRKGADQQGIAPQRGEARDHGIFEHVTREAGVLADDDFQFSMAGLGAVVTENMGGGTAQLESGLGCYRLDIRSAPNAVGSKKFFRVHGLFQSVLFRLGEARRVVAVQVKFGRCPADVLLDEIPEGDCQKQARELCFPVV